jgi:Lantibiotic modifying enzyme
MTADYSFPRVAAPSSQGNAPYLRAATAVAKQLVADAISVGSGSTWVGDDLQGESPETSTLVREPVGPSLYSGAAGIAWFLGHLATEDDSEGFARTAISGLSYALSEANGTLDDMTLSLHGGATGVALAAVEVGACLENRELFHAGTSLAGRIAKLIGTGYVASEVDLMGGAAGIVIGLLAIYRRTAEEQLVNACKTACHAIISNRRTDCWGSSWSPPHARKPDGLGLCGLGHGASGIALALAEMAWITGEARFWSVAEDAFLYERSWFSRDTCAWPDLREPASSAPDETYPAAWTTAWCHGALGIGAARLRVYEMTQDLTALAEASAAIHSARGLAAQAGMLLRSGSLVDVTLCHGLTGAVELMLMAHEVSGHFDHYRAARTVGDTCLSIFKRNGGKWTCGLQKANDIPGLFLGSAGVGVTMMRLHDHSMIGSPLLAGRMQAGPSKGAPAVPRAIRTKPATHQARRSGHRLASLRS